MEAMASLIKPSTCAIAKFTHGLTGRQAASCKPWVNPSSPWPSSFQRRPSRRRSSQVQCKAKTLKHAKPLDALELQERFGSENLLFSDVGGMTVIELKLNSGNSARVLLNEVRITSYKCRLWHGSIEEFLHTDVLEPASEIAANHTSGVAPSLSPPEFVIMGGIVPSLAHSLPPHLPLFDNKWLVDRVQVDPEEQVQVLLRSADESRGGWQYTLQCVITLTKRYLASCVVITNNDKKPMTFNGSITTHLAIRATEALCAAGLQDCEYYSPSEAARRVAAKSAMANSLFGRLKRVVLGESNEKGQDENNASSAEGTREMQEQNYRNAYQDRTNWFTEKTGDVVTFANGVHKLYSEPSKQIRITDQEVVAHGRDDGEPIERFVAGPWSIDSSWTSLLGAFSCDPPAIKMLPSPNPYGQDKHCLELGVQVY